MSASNAGSTNGSKVERFEEGQYVQVSYLDQKVTGLVWSYAEAEGLLVLQIIASNGEVEVAMIRQSEITNSSVVATTDLPKRVTALVKLDAVDVTLARRTEEKKVAVEKAKAEGINQSVSRQAQDLFHRLMHLNITCQWDNLDIVIPASHIRIQPPYAPENCSLTGDASLKGALDRIQKIVASAKK